MPNKSMSNAMFIRDMKLTEASSDAAVLQLQADIDVGLKEQIKSALTKVNATPVAVEIQEHTLPAMELRIKKVKFAKALYPDDEHFDEEHAECMQAMEFLLLIHNTGKLNSLREFDFLQRYALKLYYTSIGVDLKNNPLAIFLEKIKGDLADQKLAGAPPLRALTEKDIVKMFLVEFVFLFRVQFYNNSHNIKYSDVLKRLEQLVLLNIFIVAQNFLNNGKISNKDMEFLMRDGRNIFKNIKDGVVKDLFFKMLDVCFPLPNKLKAPFNFSRLPSELIRATAGFLGNADYVKLTSLNRGHIHASLEEKSKRLTANALVARVNKTISLTGGIALDAILLNELISALSMAIKVSEERIRTSEKFETLVMNHALQLDAKMCASIPAGTCVDKRAMFNVCHPTLYSKQTLLVHYFDLTKAQGEEIASTYSAYYDGEGEVKGRIVTKVEAASADKNGGVIIHFAADQFIKKVLPVLASINQRPSRQRNKPIIEELFDDIPPPSALVRGLTNC